MNEDLRRLVRERLESDGLLPRNWSSLVLAACEGRDALDGILQNAKTTGKADEKATATAHAGAYLTSLTVEGFRGIGPKQTLTLTPGPGLTIVVGRNGSGKSSFAEALEVLLTNDNRRWAKGRSKVWQEGWRNLHQDKTAAIEAKLDLEGGGQATVGCSWDAQANLDAQKSVAQIKGKSKTTLQGLGWTPALSSYRPFLSYNELGSMLDEGPTKLYDALSLVLGLEDLVNAQSALADCRLARQKSLDIADEAREQFVEQLKTLIAEEPDDRASACLDALTSKNWGLDAVEKIISTGAVPAATQDIAVLTRAVALDAGDPTLVAAVVRALRSADAKLKAVAGSDADGARQTASLLEAALSFHASHGDTECPVCGGKPGLNAKWAKQSRAQIDRLKIAAAGSDDAHRGAEMARRRAIEMMAAPPKLLVQLFDIGVEGLDTARRRWDAWHAGASIKNLLELADHLESHQEAFADAIDDLKNAAAAELKRREDRWRPIATSIAGWIDLARKTRAAAEDIPRIKEAEKWLKDASADIRNQRFAPIADKAMATWEHLRQQSNVTLGKIELVGTGTKRKVSLDVTVDGVAGAALGVMSQGELHSLALSLFLPRATLPESPFRFVVIDDPVQSMDPARVDGLARALEETAKNRQVIVFTHDERLPEAVRRLGIESRMFMVTRRPGSVVEVRKSLDPVRAHIEDALALVHTTDLPNPVLRRTVPGFCRAALESALISVIRRRQLLAGKPHSEVEEALAKGGKLTPLAALAFFDDRERGSEVMARVNKYGGWAGDAFKQCNEGAHKEYAGDLKQLINDSEKLAERIQAL